LKPFVAQFPDNAWKDWADNHPCNIPEELFPWETLLRSKTTRTRASLTPWKYRVIRAVSAMSIAESDVCRLMGVSRVMMHRAHRDHENFHMANLRSDGGCSTNEEIYEHINNELLKALNAIGDKEYNPRAKQ
jgi:hypothetical protein